ncbi:MAG TPA: hypothetical protein VFA39_06390 [Steroidobacteraceae bacterium]|nr:hypothetical protein [Steroidobacteraceae bacterium]
MATKKSTTRVAKARSARSTADTNIRGAHLACALRLMRCCDSLLADGGPLTAEIFDVGEVIRCAAQNLTTWLEGIDVTAPGGPSDAHVFDALDACTAAAALIEAGLNPRNDRTISPIKGILRLGACRLAQVVAEVQS